MLLVAFPETEVKHTILTNIWKSLLSYGECPLLFMIENSYHIFRPKISPVDLPKNENFIRRSIFWPLTSLEGFGKT